MLSQAVSGDGIPNGKVHLTMAINSKFNANIGQPKILWESGLFAGYRIRSTILCLIKPWGDGYLRGIDEASMKSLHNRQISRPGARIFYTV